MNLCNRRLKKWSNLLIWMMVIFLLSNQPHSGTTTYGIIEKILPIGLESSVVDTINFLVRKCAHFTEYFILSYLIYSLLGEYFKVKRDIVIKSILFCFLYALIDEFHQLFVPGRSGVFRDCIIDMFGCFFYLILKYFLPSKSVLKR